jgi:hypothetical protein
VGGLQVMKVLLQGPLVIQRRLQLCGQRAVPGRRKADAGP